MESPRCKATIDWFLEDGAGGFYGQLTSDVTFRQYPIVDGSYLHRMQIEDAYYFVDEKGTFNAEDNTQALSIHLNRVYGT
jgi:hypothetical protein